MAFGLRATVLLSGLFLIAFGQQWMTQRDKILYLSGFRPKHHVLVAWNLFEIVFYLNIKHNEEELFI